MNETRVVGVGEIEILCGVDSESRQNSLALDQRDEVLKARVAGLGLAEMAIVLDLRLAIDAAIPKEIDNWVSNQGVIVPDPPILGEGIVAVDCVVHRLASQGKI